MRNKIINATSSTVTIDVVDSELRKPYPKYARPFRFVENHDEVRVASSHDTQRSKLMHTILMTANGVPLIYSGGEVGEVTNRGIIDWSDPDKIRPYFKSLIKTRKSYLTNPTIERITNSYPDKRYTYTSKSDENILLTYVNFDSDYEERDVFINRDLLPNDGVSTYYLTNLYNGEFIEILQGDNTISLDTLYGHEAIVYYYGTEKITVDVSENENLIIENYQLSQNYPNPFNPVTQISYQIPETTFVSIKVYDLLGREVTTLVNSQVATGRYNVTFNAANLSSGIYFYTMKAGDFVSTKKLILLK